MSCPPGFRVLKYLHLIEIHPSCLELVGKYVNLMVKKYFKVVSLLVCGIIIVGERGGMRLVTLPWRSEKRRDCSTIVLKLKTF